MTNPRLPAISPVLPAIATRFACEVKGFDASTVLEPHEARKLDPFALFAMAAAQEAVRDGGIDPAKEDRTRFGCIVGVGIGGLTGLIGELVTWLFTRYRNFALSRLVLAGAVGGLVEFALILGSLRSTQFEVSILVAALLVSALTFGICAGLAKWLADAVARTGVLANTPLGRANIEEI